jgi:hypothetical protein
MSFGPRSIGSEVPIGYQLFDVCMAGICCVMRKFCPRESKRENAKQLPTVGLFPKEATQLNRVCLRAWRAEQHAHLRRDGCAWLRLLE